MTHLHRRFQIVILSISMLGGSLCAWSHADLEVLIGVCTAELQRQPANSSELYFQRGDLHRRHANYALAHADFARAAVIRPGWDAVKLAQALTFMDEGRFEQALASANSLLTHTSRPPTALILSAQVLVKLEKPSAAATNYSEAISHLAAPSPDVLLERASAQAAAGQLNDAVRGLDEGMAKIGEIPSLQSFAIGYERRLGDFNKAIARVEKVIVRFPVKEPWLALEAEIYEEAGRNQDAMVVFKRVLEGIEKYPDNRRGIDMTREIEARVRAGLARVESKLLTSGKPDPLEPKSALIQKP